MEHLDVEFAHRLILGQLDEAAAQHWDAHLRACAECARLVAEERSWSNLLRLEPGTGSASASEIADRLLPKLEALLPATARRRRWRQRLLLCACAACILIAAAATWRRVTTPTIEARFARELAISTETQARIIADLDALRTLQQDPWVAEELDTVATLDALLRDSAGAN